MASKLVTKKDSMHSEDSDSDVIEDHEIIQMQKKKTQKKQGVSAEAFGKYNEKKQYVPKVIPKTADQVKRMEARLNQSFLFNSLSKSDQKIIIDVFEEKKFKAGDYVIKQGDDGDVLYLVDTGELDCSKKFGKDQPEKHLKVYKQGESFGELALLYNAPRAATIRAKTDCVLFSLDRECFNSIVKDAAQKKREQYDKLFSSIDILSSLDSYEKQQVADALRTRSFKKGDFIIKEGEIGDTFYFLEEGEAIATKTVKVGQKAEQVLAYKKGGYFGELSLLTNQKRQANIVATTDCVVAELDRGSFKRLLGSLEDILKKNFVKYEHYLKE